VQFTPHSVQYNLPCIQYKSKPTIKLAICEILRKFGNYSTVQCTVYTIGKILVESFILYFLNGSHIVFFIVFSTPLLQFITVQYVIMYLYILQGICLQSAKHKNFAKLFCTLQ